MKIVFSITAKKKLQLIYDYYSFQASDKVAIKIINEIIKKTESLQSAPQLGSKEELLSEEKTEYRKVVSGNYNIIYHIDNNILIDTVFDCRQEPDKLKNEI
jgi:plasmid stabilization system protein ParE